MLAIVSGRCVYCSGLARLVRHRAAFKAYSLRLHECHALTVLLSQVTKLLSFSVTAKGPLRQAWAIITKILDGNANVAALGIGASTLVLILMLKRKPRLPSVLIAVVAATVVVAAFDLATRAGVKVLGPLPRGLPSPRLPFVPVDD